MHASSIDKTFALCKKTIVRDFWANYSQRVLDDSSTKDNGSYSIKYGFSFDDLSNADTQHTTPADVWIFVTRMLWKPKIDTEKIKQITLLFIFCSFVIEFYTVVQHKLETYMPIKVLLIIVYTSYFSATW